MEFWRCGKGVPSLMAGEWWVYILSCADGTLYTGVTLDVERRLHEHNFSDRLAAKYTKVRRPLELVYSESMQDKSSAYRREMSLKKLTRAKKLELIGRKV